MAKPTPALFPLAEVMVPALALILSGCVDGDPEAAQLVRDSAGVTIVENQSPAWTEGEGWAVAESPSLDIGTLDGEVDYQFFRMAGAVRMKDGRIAVANGGSGEVRFFDDQGRFLRAVGRKGSGPGEFEDIYFLRRFRGDSLLVYDWRLRRMSVLSPQGDFARHFQVTVLTTSGGFPVVADPLPNGDILLAADMFATQSRVTVDGARRDSAVYYRIRPEGASWDTLGAFPGGESYVMTEGETAVGGGLAFGKYGYAAVAGDGFYYGSADDYEIDYRSSAGELLRLVRLDHDNLPVTQADIDSFVAGRMASARDEESRQLFRAMYARMPFPSSMAAYGEFLVDGEGNLWVAETRRPGDEQPRWKIFDPGGIYLGEIETPKRLRIYEVGSGYVLGRGRDEFDVDHLLMYPLLQGPQGSSR